MVYDACIYLPLLLLCLPPLAPRKRSYLSAPSGSFGRHRCAARPSENDAKSRTVKGSYRKPRGPPSTRRVLIGGNDACMCADCLVEEDCISIAQGAFIVQLQDRMLHTSGGLCARRCPQEAWFEVLYRRDQLGQRTVFSGAYIITVLQ